MMSLRRANLSHGTRAAKALTAGRSLTSTTSEAAAQPAHVRADQAGDSAKTSGQKLLLWGRENGPFLLGSVATLITAGTLLYAHAATITALRSDITKEQELRAKDVGKEQELRAKDVQLLEKEVELVRAKTFEEMRVRGG